MAWGRSVSVPMLGNTWPVTTTLKSWLMELASLGRAVSRRG